MNEEVDSFVLLPSLQQPHHPGGLTSLLSIAMEPSTEPAVRQIAAIAVKNAIKKEWEDRGELVVPMPRFGVLGFSLDFLIPLWVKVP